MIPRPGFSNVFVLVFGFGFARVSPGQALVCARSWRKEGGKGNCEDRRRARVERTSTAAAKLKCGATVVSLSTSTTEMVRRGSRPQTGRFSVDSKACGRRRTLQERRPRLKKGGLGHDTAHPLGNRASVVAGDVIAVKVTDRYGVVPFSLVSSGSHFKRGGRPRGKNTASLSWRSDLRGFVFGVSPGEKRYGNDPSAGSPTETLLRLLLPLNDRVRSSSPGIERRGGTRKPTPGGVVGQIRGPHRTVRSVVATGGVYKGQGRDRRGLLTRAYREFLVHGVGYRPRSLSREVVERFPDPLGPGRSPR